MSASSWASDVTQGICQPSFAHVVLHVSQSAPSENFTNVASWQ